MLISTIGFDGIDRVARMSLPVVDRVTYVIVWQMPGMTHETVVPAQLVRDDIRVIVSGTRGLSRSRNIAISESSADLSLIADDDTVFLPGAFTTILTFFSANPTADIALFRIAGKEKRYPAKHTRLTLRFPRGYWLTSPEIAFRTASVKGTIRFRENFGLGAPRFTAAEESFFITDAMRSGLAVDIVPAEICVQLSPSSGEKPYTPDGGFPASQGAYIRHCHGLVSGLPRIILFALRARLTRKAPFFSTLRHAFSGFTCKTAEML